MKKSAQNLLEYVLIFSFVAIAAVGIATGFDFNKLKNYIFMKPADANDPSKITIEAMTP